MPIAMGSAEKDRLVGMSRREGRNKGCGAKPGEGEQTIAFRLYSWSRVSPTKSGTVGCNQASYG